MIKPGLSRVACSSTFSRFVSLLERFDSGALHLLRALTYHRVDDPAARPHLYPNLISATPDDFARQMEFLAENYRVLSIFELQESLRTDCKLPPRSVLLTFDDAYRDFAEIAWPIIKGHNLPVTLFVPTGFPDQPERVFWWDRLHRAALESESRETWETPAGRLSLGGNGQRQMAVRQLAAYVKSLSHGEAMEFVDWACRELGGTPGVNEVLDWDSLRVLYREGVTLGAHTRSHPLMNRISLEQARSEAVGSLNDLERQIGAVPPVLAYPAGGCGAELAEMLGQEGFSLAFTTSRGINDLRTANPLLLRRINVGRNTTEAALRAQLLGWAVHLNRWLR